jgi:hypothetical protein
MQFLSLEEVLAEHADSSQAGDPPLVHAASPGVRKSDMHIHGGSPWPTTVERR